MYRLHTRQGGSLGELMPHAKGGVLDEGTIAWAMKELCTALVYLHGERKVGTCAS
jgi:serine/threonine protein kinase